MIPKETNTLRFAVGTPKETLSLTWRLWVLGDEAYLGARTGDNNFKISLRDGGIWRAAYVSGLNSNDSGEDEIIAKWHKPEEFAPGWTTCVTVTITPPQAGQIHLNSNAIDKRIVWIEAPREGKQVAFKILTSLPGLKKYDLSKILAEGESLIGSLEKANGEKLWLVRLIQEAGTHTLDTNTVQPIIVVPVQTPTNRTPPEIFDISARTK